MPREATRESAEHTYVRRRARPWRRLTVLGGALMVLSFFLPAVRSCSSDIVPAHDLTEIVSEIVGHPSASQVPNYTLWVPMLLTAYLIAFLLALAASTRLLNWAAGDRWIAWLVLLALIVTALDVAGAFAWIVVRDRSWPPDWYEWFSCGVGPFVTLVYVSLAWRPPERRWLCLPFLVSWWMCCWFAFWALWADARYGVYLSLVAGAMLLVAAIGEARALTQQGWLQTIGQLCIGRLVPSSDLRGHCPGCGYLLYGLTVQRCPECGRAFTLDEVGLPHTPLGSPLPENHHGDGGPHAS